MKFGALRVIAAPACNDVLRCDYNMPITSGHKYSRLRCRAPANLCTTALRCSADNLADLYSRKCKAGQFNSWYRPTV